MYIHICLKILSVRLTSIGSRRWQSLEKNKQVIKALAIDESLKLVWKNQVQKTILSDVFWDQVKVFLNLLEPICVAITKVEGDKAAISKVMEIFCNLEEKVKTAVSSSPLLKAEQTTS
jgi:hypothetical protein